MESRDKDNKWEAEGSLKGKFTIKSHINTLYILGLIDANLKAELMERLENAGTVKEGKEAFDYIISLYNVIGEDKKTSAVALNNNVDAVAKMLEDINDSSSEKDGQVALEALTGAINSIQSLEVGKKVFKEEIILNIQAVRESLEKETPPDEDNINVIINMLKQLKL